MDIVDVLEVGELEVVHICKNMCANVNNKLSPCLSAKDRLPGYLTTLSVSRLYRVKW
jgi:hypothetical protein